MAKQLHVSHVKSSVLNKVPAATAVTFGEIAVNYNPGSPALYIKNASNGMVKFSPQTYVDENFVHSAEYYSSGSTHEIRFKNASGTTLSTVNADDFIKDGMVSDVYVTTARTMVITFNTDAGHEDIELALSDIFDPDIYYTKDEIDDAELAIAASLNDLNDRKADKSYVDDAISASTIEIDDMLDSGSTNPVENRAVWQAIVDNEEAIESALNDLDTRKADKTYVDEAVSSITIDVDSVLDSASTNPVENRVIYNALNNVSIDVDDHMDSASTNPVQNKVLWKVIADDEKVISAALNNLNDNKADKSYVDAAITGVTIDVDDQLDSASTNPVENRVIYQALQNVGVTVDSVMDSASTNPVQNKVVYQYILDNELVVAASLNELNGSKADKSYVDAAVTGVTVQVDNHADTTIPDTGYTSSQMHLPEVTSADNGKTLRVVDGEWALVEETNVYTGSGAPSQSLGNNGDIYLETS